MHQAKLMAIAGNRKVFFFKSIDETDKVIMLNVWILVAEGD